MPEQGVANEVKVATAALHLVLMNSELASSALGLMQIELGCHLEDNISNLDANWMQLWCNFLARSHHLAEVVVVDAVEIHVTNILLPFLLQMLECCLWNTEV